MPEFDPTSYAKASRNSRAMAELSKYPQTSVMYEKAVKEIEIIPKGSLTQAQTAISSKIIKVALVGTSISEGADQVNSIDAYPNKIIKKLESSLPDVAITFQNFALGGRNITLFNDANYVAVNPETDNNVDFWRSWATVGKSWKDHVKDFAPDLLIIEFGINDAYAGGDADYTFYTNLDILKTYISTWAKLPSIVLLPTILPTINTALYSQRQDVTQAVARVTREFAKANGYAIADVNRLFRILRDGIDDVSRTSEAIVLSENYPINWIGDTSSWTKSGNVLLASDETAKAILYNRTFYNGTISIKVKNNVAGGDGAAYIGYRANDIGRFTVTLVSGDEAFIGLYYQAATTETIAFESITLPFGTEAEILIVVDGTKHQIYVDGVLKINAATFYNLRDGAVTLIGPVALPNFETPTVIFADPISGYPLYTESELLGYQDSPASGNGINHPTGLGHDICFVPAFNGILDKLVT